MSESIVLNYIVDGDDFVSCGKATEDVKFTLRGIGIRSDIIRKIAIAMYEGEVNMVIHANGGTANVEITSEYALVNLIDTGKGIEDIEQAMQEGYSTATDAIRELGFGAGMGLPNMKKYADEMQVKSELGKGTEVTMKFKLT